MYLLLYLLDKLMMLIFVLLNIAFVTLLERKILGYSQSRLGPNKPSIYGLFQPMADAVKLFSKNFSTPVKTHKLMFFSSPIMMLVLVLLLWTMIPDKFESYLIIYSVILLLTILSLNVYPMILSGWSSSNKYSMIGSLRSVAQTISYEISLALIVMIVSIYLSIMSLDFLMKIKTYYFFSLIAPMVLVLWMVSSLAETNRTPFDFSEGESELVSGFNTEYGASGFAMIFMAEYGSIYLLSIISSMMFFWGKNIFFMSMATAIFIFIWVWTRTTFPRYRYDLLMNLAWKTILPVVLSISIFVLSLVSI